MRFVRPLSIACLLLSSGCLVPARRQVTVRPELTVTVTDSTGAAVADADLLVRRVVVAPPPGMETHRWTGRTDVQGQASFSYLEQRETYLPLMMHGVNWYGWEVCAKATNGAATTRVDAPGALLPSAQVNLKLDPTARECVLTGP